MASRPSRGGASVGMELHWYRLTLDINPAGDCVGTSYEVRHADRIVAIHVLPKPRHGANAHDELEDLSADIEERYGVQLQLF